MDTGTGVISALYRAILRVCAAFLGPRLEFGIHVTVYWKVLHIRVVKTYQYFVNIQYSENLMWSPY